MIIQEYGKHKLVCENCEDTLEFDNFEDAVEHKKRHGWKSFLYEGVWEDYCPDCLEDED